MSAGKALRLTDRELGLSYEEDAYLITFSTRLQSYAEERGWNYSPELAPSSFLFAQMQHKKSLPDYNRGEVFENYYKPRFLDQLDNKFSLNRLEEIVNKLLQGRNVLLVCFCGEELYCHRSIIKEIILTSIEAQE